jgi:hypothetical protein
MAVNFPVSVTIQAVDHATAKVRAITAGIARATSPLKRLGTSLSGLSEAAQLPKLMDGFRGVGSAIGDLGAAARRSALLIGGIAAAAGVATFSIVNGFAKAAESVLRGSQKIGIGVESLQELRYAAELADTPIETLDNALGKLAERAALAARGQKSALVPFQRLGIAIEDSAGKIRRADDLLKEIADKFGRLDDPAKKAALAVGLFGKAGKELLPMLEGGTKGLADAAAEARALGIVMSHSAAVAGDDFGDNLTRVKSALEGVRNTIGDALLPVLNDLAVEFKDFLVKHRPQIRALAKWLSDKLPEAIRKTREAFVALWEKTKPARELFEKIYEKVGPLGIGIGVLAGILTVTLGPAILSVIASLATLSVALLTTPAGWVALALAGVAIALAAVTAGVIYAYMHWDELSARFPATAALVEAFTKGALGNLLKQLAVLAVAVGPVLEAGFQAFLGQLIGAVGYATALIDHFETLARFFGLSNGLSHAAAKPIEASVRAEQREQDAARLIGGGARSISASELKILVDFMNVPKGARVSTSSKGSSAQDLNMSMGYAMQSQ